MNYQENLREQRGTEQTALARIDLDIFRLENMMLKCERYSLKWNQFLVNLNSLKQKRKILMSRIVELKMEIDKTSRFSVSGF